MREKNALTAKDPESRMIQDLKGKILLEYLSPKETSPFYLLPFQATVA
jgi:hypothetical protein